VLRDEDGRIVGGVETFRDLSAEEALRKELRRNYTFEDIVSKNHKMREIFAVLPDVAKSGCNVLVEGESGTGKELVARALHHLSEQRRGPYVAVNCAALPDALLESELFGYVRGAFTDAKRNKPGRFALAAGGTIFLDEIGSVSGALQVKLLRVLQERVFEPLGGVAPTRMEARVIAATNRDLAALVQAGEFRQDLYYRLNVVRLQLPSLRERREDVPLLAEHFLRHFNLKQGKEVLGLLPETLAVLLDYSWPGNVRELENAIEHAFVMCRGSYLGPEHLPRELTARLTPVQAPATLQDAEQEMLQQVLAKHHGKYVEAARELGIHRTTLYRKRRKYQLQ
jgi:transcriptional regulator with PAS, ATPase and Fis domain